MLHMTGEATFFSRLVKRGLREGMMRGYLLGF
jgi:hypothetical protein